MLRAGTGGGKRGITLGRRGFSVISQVGDSVALVRSSEEDVYYRNDSMKSVARRNVLADCERRRRMMGRGSPYKVDMKRKDLGCAARNEYILAGRQVR